MAKVKVTLSVAADLLKEAKVCLAEKGGTLSGALEETLREMATSNVINDIASAIGVEAGYVGYEEVVKTRPKGADAARAIREIRDAREKAVLG